MMKYDKEELEILNVFELTLLKSILWWSKKSK